MSRGHVFVGPFLAACVLAGGSVTSASAERQAASAANPVLPSSVKLADIEVRLAYTGHGGCAGRCIRYNVIVRGNGFVEYEDMGGEPRDARRRRTVPIAEVVSLVDAFVRSRFFDALPRYETYPVAVRDGNSVRFDRAAQSDGPEWDLTLRLGTQTKTVHLYLGFSEELRRLRDLVEKLGGPGAWAAKQHASSARLRPLAREVKSQVSPAGLSLVPLDSRDLYARSGLDPCLPIRRSHSLGARACHERGTERRDRDEVRLRRFAATAGQPSPVRRPLACLAEARW
jgi:hypothetical protein